ncbi:MAG: DUF427 domain-containing protein [Microcystaceae cyanobacterium]
MFQPKPIPPQPGQESVWDYPRPPRLEPSAKTIKILFAGVVLAQTQKSYRVLETSHPPVYYLPPSDIAMEYLQETSRNSYCEWKGIASYYTIKVGDTIAENAAWFYPNPTPTFAPIKDYIAFYPSPMEACYVDDEQVIPQAGSFYGGWITKDIVGPFKG